MKNFLTYVSYHDSHKGGSSLPQRITEAQGAPEASMFVWGHIPQFQSFGFLGQNRRVHILHPWGIAPEPHHQRSQNGGCDVPLFCTVCSTLRGFVEPACRTLCWGSLTSVGFVGFGYLQLILMRARQPSAFFKGDTCREAYTYNSPPRLANMLIQDPTLKAA